MSDPFNDREKAFEAKYRLDQETQFKVNVRRDKLFGRWAADQMGISGDEADAYCRAVIEADFAEPGDDDVLRKVGDDLRAAGIDVTETSIRRTLAKLGEIAKEQIVAEIAPKKGG